MRRLITSVCLALVAGLALLCDAKAQEIATASYERGPRFLLAMATKVIPVDVSKTPVLARRLNLELEGATLKQALAEIAAQSGLVLAYSDDAVPLDKRVHLQAETITAAAALTDVLFDAGVDVVFKADGSAALVKRPPLAQNGSISGRVTDAKSSSAIVGATVVIERTSLSATTDNDGRYRIADVAPGAYTVRTRYIGYAPATASVTVSADREATADFALEKSVQRLEEVVTTGTLAPTEVKAIPTPITVISGNELQQRGYQRVDQIFRGDVPGAIAWDRGANGYTSDVNMRGASSAVQNYVKTYIDGVEVADPTYIANIDPKTIDRIEILRGPQGSTLYGSQASGGVMQIFTKHGDASARHPQLELRTSAGVIESPWSKASVQQDHSVAVTGGAPDFSYRLGGGYARQGDYLPDYYADNLNLAGALQTTQGRVHMNLSARYLSKTLGAYLDPRFRDAGYVFWSKPFNESIAIQQQTYGLNLSVAATPWWQHNLTLGYDRTGFGDDRNQPRFTTPDDSLLFAFNTDQSKSSLAYNSTVRLSLGSVVQSSLTTGADYWTYQQGGFFAGSPPTTANLIPSPDFGFRSDYHNTGFFAQEQLGVWDALFITGGLRAEQNSNFGRSFDLAWAPRAGVSYVRTFGNISAKARLAYGKAIRPPNPGEAQALVTGSSVQLANPRLGPEQQRGWDGGFELYFAPRGSFNVTYYSQKAIDLIDVVQIDTAFQFQNVGQIRNRGWEFQGSLNAGRFSLTGTYSITRSVVQQLSPTYTGDLLPGDQMLGIPRHTGGATLSYDLPKTTVAAGVTAVGSWTEVDYLALYASDLFYGTQPFRGSIRDYWIRYPGFTKLRVSISRSLPWHLTAFLRSDNVTNKNVYERYNINLNFGRSTVLGLQTTF
jgi:outer membrane receptor protein involved in Fe transport